MQRFLSNIRKKLIDQSRLRKYLLYGLGEILLIVIGILIAVQINNWNESRQNDAKEKKVLSELLSEFEINQNKFETQIEALNNNIESHNAFIKSMVEDDLNLQTMNEFHRGRQLTVGTMNPTMGTINTILYTGDIALIKNDSIRNAISNWGGILEDYVENETFHLNYYFNELHPYLREHFLLVENSMFPDTPIENITAINFKGVKQIKYRNLILDNLNWNKTLKGLAQNTLDSLILLKTQIEDELKRL